VKRILITACLLFVIFQISGYAGKENSATHSLRKVPLKSAIPDSASLWHIVHSSHNVRPGILHNVTASKGKPKQLPGIVVNVTDYGAKPWSFENVVPAVKLAILACNKNTPVVLVFPRGRYDFWPEHAEQRNYFISNTSSAEECPSKLKTIGLLFDKMKNLTIEGNGSLFVFHGKMTTFVFDHCENIQLSDLKVDFERPTMSEMTFREVSDSVITAAIHPDSKYSINESKLKWYGEGWGMEHFHAILVKPGEGTEFYTSWTPFQQAKTTAMTPGLVSFKGDFKNYHFRPGEVLTIRDPIRDQVGMFINQSKNIHLKNVSMQYMHGLGIVSQFSENLYYDSVSVMPDPESGRMIAAFADCMHFSGCKGQIILDGCHFKGAHDDPVNVHGTYLKITGVLSPTTFRIRFMHPQTYGFNAFFKGDSIALVHGAALQTYGTAVIVSAKLISEKEMLVELARPVPGKILPGDCIENITWTPSVMVHNCRFERTNTRGLLITTRRKVVIEHNIFYRTGMQAILIAGDASSWFESGAVQDISIQNNIFEDCGYQDAGCYVIAIAPENHVLIPGYMVHRNIRIENNLFKVLDSPVLTARSTGGLLFKNNTIVRTDFRKQNKDYPLHFNLIACRNVEIKDNPIDGFNNATVQLEDMDQKELSTDITDVKMNEHNEKTR
jgi:hypothetical protein